MQSRKLCNKSDHSDGTRRLALPLSIAVIFSCQLAAGADLSRYRQFAFGMSSAAVSQLIGVETSKVVIVHQRPALVEELPWIPYLYSGRVNGLDPVRDMVFRFLDGQLYRILIHYDPQKTEGMSSADLTESISRIYGVPGSLRPHSRLSLGDSESADILARWQDQQFSFSLVRTGYAGDFGLLAISKALDHNADLAIAEAVRLDEQERPARERQQAKDISIAKEKVRPVNKANFRP
jgi:hypothetical protein